MQAPAPPRATFDTRPPSSASAPASSISWWRCSRWASRCCTPTWMSSGSRRTGGAGWSPTLLRALWPRLGRRRPSAAAAAVPCSPAAAATAAAATAAAGWTHRTRLTRRMRHHWQRRGCSSLRMCSSRPTSSTLTRTRSAPRTDRATTAGLATARALSDAPATSPRHPNPCPLPPLMTKAGHVWPWSAPGGSALRCAVDTPRA